MIDTRAQSNYQAITREEMEFNSSITNPIQKKLISQLGDTSMTDDAYQRASVISEKGAAFQKRRNSAYGAEVSGRMAALSNQNLAMTEARVGTNMMNQAHRATDQRDFSILQHLSGQRDFYSAQAQNMAGSAASMEQQRNSRNRQSKARVDAKNKGSTMGLVSLAGMGVGMMVGIPPSVTTMALGGVGMVTS